MAMAADDRLLALVAEPSLPLSGKGKKSIDISPSDLDNVRHRCAVEGLEVLGLRFKGDR